MATRVPTSIRRLEKHFKGKSVWPLEKVDYKVEFAYGELLVAGFTALSPIPVPTKGETIWFQHELFLVVGVEMSYSASSSESDEGRTMQVLASVDIRPVDPGYVNHA